MAVSDPDFSEPLKGEGETAGVADSPGNPTCASSSADAPNAHSASEAANAVAISAPLKPKIGPNAPVFVRCTVFAIAALCVVLGLLFLTEAWYGGSWWLLGFAVVPLLATAGLLRGLRWGRTAASLLDVAGAFFMASVLMGDIDEPDERTVLAVLTGVTMPVWMNVLFIVACVSVFLAPLVVIGWHKRYFRKTIW